MIDLDQLDREHVPFTDTNGQPIAVPGEKKLASEFPIQCRKDAKAYPCDVRQLLDLIKEMRAGASVPPPVTASQT
jgi:hypothetical protein